MLVLLRWLFPSKRYPYFCGCPLVLYLFRIGEDLTFVCRRITQSFWKALSTLYPHRQTLTLQSSTATLSTRSACTSETTRRSSVPIRLRPPWAKVMPILALAQLANSSSPTNMQNGLALSLSKVTPASQRRMRPRLRRRLSVSGANKKPRTGGRDRSPARRVVKGPLNPETRVNSEMVPVSRERRKKVSLVS